MSLMGISMLLVRENPFHFHLKSGMNICFKKHKKVGKTQKVAAVSLPLVYM